MRRHLTQANLTAAVIATLASLVAFAAWWWELP